MLTLKAIPRSLKPLLGLERSDVYALVTGPAELLDLDVVLDQALGPLPDVLLPLAAWVKVDALSWRNRGSSKGERRAGYGLGQVGEDHPCRRSRHSVHPLALSTLLGSTL